MKQPDRLNSLPPKVNYTGKNKAARDQVIYFAMHSIKAEFQLYKRTRNGAHMWLCYQLWRRLMPEDLPLPRQLLSYFDQCAEGIASDTEPRAIKEALDLMKAPGLMAEHGGGASGRTAAEPVRKQRDAMEYIRGELLGALIRGETPRGYKSELYKNAAGKFGYSISHIKRLLHDWPVAQAVKQDFNEWSNRQK